MTHSTEVQEQTLSSSQAQDILENRLAQIHGLLMVLQQSLREADSFHNWQLDNASWGVLELTEQAWDAFRAMCKAPGKPHLANDKGSGLAENSGEPNHAAAQPGVTHAKLISLDQIDKLSALLHKSTGVMTCLVAESQYGVVSEEVLGNTLWAVDGFLDEMKVVVSDIDSEEGAA